jgi:hypothetical protein
MDETPTECEHTATADDDQSSAPVHKALLDGNVKLALKLLGDGASVHGRWGWKKTSLLHTAAQYGFKPVVEILIRNGANLNSVENLQQTPLHKACHGKHTSVVETLLLNGAKIDLQDFQGRTALHAAAQFQPDVVKLLLQHGANAALKTTDGKTPLDLAFFNSHQYILLSNNAHVKEVATVCDACRGITFTSLSAPERKLPNLKKRIKGYVHSTFSFGYRNQSCMMCMQIHTAIRSSPMEDEGLKICLSFDEASSLQGHQFIMITLVSDKEIYSSPSNKFPVIAEEGMWTAYKHC